MKRWISLVALLAVAGLIGGLAWSSAGAEEPGSAFAGHGSAPFIEAARAEGHETERILSGPLALRTDSRIVPEETLLVVVAPGTSYTQEEADFVRGFLESGGRLLVADDFGQANSLTASLGVAFERVRLVETANEGTMDIDLGGQVLHVTSKQPTALRLDPHAETTVLSYSTGESFLDRDGSGIIDESDPQGPFPLVAETTVGAGKLIALSDTTSLTQAGGNGTEDDAWRAALLDRLLPDGGIVLIDESHAGTDDPFVASVRSVVGTATSSPWRYVLGGLGGLALLLVLKPLYDMHWGPHRFRPDRFRRRTELADIDEEEQTVRVARWTPRGTAATLGAIALATGGLVLGNNQAAYAGAFLTVALAASLLPRVPDIEAVRMLSQDQLQERNPVQVKLSMKGGRRRALVEVRDQVNEAFEITEGTNWTRVRLGRSVTEIDYETVPSVRGPYKIGPLVVRRSDVLNLRSHDLRVDAGDDVRVAPRPEDVRRTPFTTKVPSVTMGPHLVNRAGDGTEFHALRDFQSGDSIRIVNWKASARSNDLVVNQRVHESMTRLTIIVDARAISAAGPASQAPIVLACRAALSIANGALRARDQVRLVLYGDGVHKVRGAPGMRQLHEVTETLARWKPKGDTPFGDVLPEVLPDLKKKQPVMLISSLEADGTIVDGIAQLRARGMLPVVLAVPVAVAPIDDPYGRPEPDAEAIEEQRTEAIAKLRSVGATVFDIGHGVPLDYMFRLGVSA